MRKILIAIAVIFVALLVLVISLRISATLYKKSLLERSDFPQITAACVTLAHSLTNEHTNWKPSDPAVPPALRSLSLDSINVCSNQATLWLHGGWERTIYYVRQSESDPRQWTLAVYSEHLGSPRKAPHHHK